MKKIAIYGAGGLGREVLQIILDINEQQPEWDLKGFIVDREFRVQNEVSGYPVHDTFQWLTANADTYIAVAIGSSAGRMKAVRRLQGWGYDRYATLVHPLAWIGRNVEIGSGSIICAGCQITTDIKIHDHVHINIGTTIGHDAELNAYVTTNPNVSISGNATLGVGVEVGTGSIVLPNRGVGDWSVLGAGSVVTTDIEANATAVGVPARIVKRRPEGWQL